MDETLIEELILELSEIKTVQKRMSQVEASRAQAYQELNETFQANMKLLKQENDRLAQELTDLSEQHMALNSLTSQTEATSKRSHEIMSKANEALNRLGIRELGLSVLVGLGATLIVLMVSHLWLMPQIRPVMPENKSLIITEDAQAALCRQALKDENWRLVLGVVYLKEKDKTELASWLKEREGKSQKSGKKKSRKKKKR